MPLLAAPARIEQLQEKSQHESSGVRWRKAAGVAQQGVPVVQKTKPTFKPEKSIASRLTIDSFEGLDSGVDVSVDGGE